MQNTYVLKVMFFKKKKKSRFINSYIIILLLYYKGVLIQVFMYESGSGLSDWKLVYSEGHFCAIQVFTR